MKNKMNKGRVIGLMLVFAMLFSCMGVFAEETNVSENMPTAVATITDEFGNVEELDVIYDIVELPSNARSNEAPMYEMTARAITSGSNTDTTSEGKVEASLTIKYNKNTDNIFSTGYKITNASGVWSPYGATLSSRRVRANSGIDEQMTKTPTENTFSYVTNLTTYVSRGYAYAVSTVKINNSSTLELRVDC